MDDASVLEARVRLLERGHRRLRLVCIALVLSLVAVAGAAVAWLVARTPTTVTAERFVLKDSGGEIRGEWAPSGVIAGEENEQHVVASITCLTMRSPKRSRASLCAPWDEPGESGLSLRDSTGTQASMSAGPLNGQVFLTARASVEDQRPRSRALLMASHVESAVMLRHDQTTSRWNSTGSVAPSPSPGMPTR